MDDENLIEIDNYLSDSTNFEFLQSIDADTVLDQRDELVFDDQWMEVYNSLNMCSFTKEDIIFIDMLREKAFKQSFRVINNSEIASRISDDIEVIAKSYIARKYNNWAITFLWASYKNNKFPA